MTEVITVRQVREMRLLGRIEKDPKATSVATSRRGVLNLRIRTSTMIANTVPTCTLLAVESSKLAARRPTAQRYLGSMAPRQGTRG